MSPKQMTEGELLEALQRLGAKRVEATLVAALTHSGGMGTRDLVAQTHLRQPEVSVGMQVLRERGWVAAEPVARRGKGRPMHRYKLVADMSSLRSFYEARGRHMIDDFLAAINIVKRHLA